MTTESLLAMFPAVPTEQWERTIRENVPGPDYAKKLIWHPEEGLAVRPYYRTEDLAGLPYLDAQPGDYPYVRGTGRKGGWRICEKIDAIDPEEANRSAVDAVAMGAEEISFRRARIENESDVALVLANLNEIPVHFQNASQFLIRTLLERLKQRPDEAGVAADMDPLADLEFSAEIIRSGLPCLKAFTIDAVPFQERAAGAVEEAGFALAAAVDFLAEMQNRGIDVDRVASAIGFQFAMGPEFFVHIAKLRAFRMVWAQAVESFGGTREHAKAVVHARPSNWDKTVYDRHINVLRATTEAMSAILGGADSIVIAPFDECCGHPDESSRRLARNTQIILKREARLDQVADPVGGSYMVEAMTNSIAKKSWKLFQKLESAGGFRKATAAGILAAVLKRREKVREEAVASRKRVLTGTNRFANAAEKAADFAPHASESSMPRAAQPFEELRRRSEEYAAAYGTLPPIVLAEIGDAKMRSARSQFAADFLGCAGLSCEVKRFDQPAQIADSGPDLIVLCSSDAEYLPIAQELMPMLREHGCRAKVVVAGNPETSEELRALGVVEFIHLRCNAIEVLAALQQQMEMKD